MMGPLAFPWALGEALWLHCPPSLKGRSPSDCWPCHRVGSLVLEGSGGGEQARDLESGFLPRAAVLWSACCPSYVVLREGGSWAWSWTLQDADSSALPRPRPPPRLSWPRPTPDRGLFSSRRTYLSLLGRHLQPTTRSLGRTLTLAFPGHRQVKNWPSAPCPWSSPWKCPCPRRLGPEHPPRSPRAQRAAPPSPRAWLAPRPRR